MLFEACAMAAVAIMMASLVLVGGAALPPPAEPRALIARQVYTPVGETGTCFEAPAVVPSTSVTVGVGTLCVDGHDLRVTLQATGLTPGDEYTGSLRYTLRPAPCRDSRTEPESPCRSVDVPDDRPTTLVKHIDAGIAAPTGVLRVQKHLNDARFFSGGEITLELLKLREDADPQAETVFVLP
jgi:hypothetical protein